MAKIPALWVVKVDNDSPAHGTKGLMDKKPKVIDGFLACYGNIAAYKRGEAIKKARMFKGKIRKLQTFGYRISA